MNKYILNEENIHQGYLILVNPSYLLKMNEFNLMSFSNEYANIALDVVANKQLHLALEKIKAGDEIVPISGYRSLNEQETLYNDSIKENGLLYTQKFVALPNASEHQTGLAIDLALNQENIDFICPSFPYEGICQKFRDIAHLYGFIERYHDHKKEITKISKEEWHFRYVGCPHAGIITEKDFCLEEYIEYLKEFDYPNNFLESYGYKISYLPYTKDKEFILNEKTTISGNNVDGFIITEKIASCEEKDVEVC